MAANPFQNANRSASTHVATNGFSGGSAGGDFPGDLDARIFIGDGSVVGKATPLDLELRIPRKATTFLVCLRIDGCMKGKVNETPSTKGMRMVKAAVV